MHHRLPLTHRLLTTLAEHRRTLEADYSTRYRQFRQRLLYAILCTLAAFASLSATTLLMAAHT